MLISQIVDGSDMIQVVARTNGATRVVNGAKSVYSLALEAARSGIGLAALIERKGFGKTVDLDAAYRQGRLIAPINHPDAAHLHLTGTGLTHLGSAATRDSMHKKLAGDGEETLTDSMKMFRMGLEAGKPEKGEVGVQPEWFYKGNGTMAVAPGAPLLSPAFAKDGGEEPEIAGIYVIGDDGTPFRVGFALSNEFSDHVTERVQLSLPRAFQAQERLLRSGDPGRRSAGRHTRHRRRSCATARRCGRSRSCRARRTCRTRSPTSSITTSSTRSSASRATCTSTCSAPRRSPLPTGSGPRPAMSSRFAAPDFGLPLRNPLKIEAPEEIAVRAL